MPTRADIEQQPQRLAVHRATLATLLAQQATFTSAYAPPAVNAGIAEARDGIARCKTTLRSWGVAVDDHPDDALPPTMPDTHAQQHARDRAALPLPEPPTAGPVHYGPQVIAASAYLEEQQENHFGTLGVVVGVGVTICLSFLNGGLRSLLAGQPISIPAIVGFVLSMALVGWYVYKHGHAWHRIQRDRKGAEQVVEQLRPVLDHRWMIYRNLQLPDRKDDLDLILVGPGGVWIVLVQPIGTSLRVQAGQWEVRRRGRWVVAQPDPSAQARGQAMQLNDFFKRNGINCFVAPAVALAEGLPFDQFETSPLPVWLPFNIAQQARALATPRPPTADELARINDLLRRRADQQRAVEAAQQKSTR